NSHARSSSSPASLRHNCSTSPASDRTPPPNSSSPGPTKDGSAPKPPSHGSPAPHPSPHPPAKRSATASTEQATASSTAHSTRSSSHANAPIPPRSPTSNAASTKARHDAKQTAASSATSPAASTGYSNTDRRYRLDRHRSITGAGERRLGRVGVPNVRRLASGVHRRLEPSPSDAHQPVSGVGKNNRRLFLSQGRDSLIARRRNFWR